MSTDIRARLDAMRARAEAATEGPWSVYTARGGTYVTRPDLMGVAREWSLVWEQGDAEFIAHSRQDLPALLAFARDVLDLADRWVEEDGPHPSHDHRCPDDLRDEVRTLAARHLGGGSDD